MLLTTGNENGVDLIIVPLLFVSNSQVIGCEDRLRNDLYCVGWGVKLYSIQSNLSLFQS